MIDPGAESDRARQRRGSRPPCSASALRDGLVLVQVGLFFGLLENAGVTIDNSARTLDHRAEYTGELVGFGDPFPEGLCSGRGRSGGGTRGRLDRLVPRSSLFLGPKRRSFTTPSRLPGLELPLGHRVGAIPPI